MFTEMCGWQHGREWIHCVMFQNRGWRFGFPSFLGTDVEGRELFGNSASFSLSVGTYYTGVNSLPWLGPVPEKPTNVKGESSKGPTTHREILLARSIPMGRLDGTLYPVSLDGSNLDALVWDALKSFNERGVPWMEKTRDVDEFIEFGLAGRKPFLKPPTKIELSPEIAQQVKDWARRRGMPGAVFYTGQFPADFPPAGRTAFEESSAQSRLSDHTALDRAPHGEDLIGLLVSKGRWDEALERQRLAAGETKREERPAEHEQSTRRRLWGSTVPEKEDRYINQIKAKAIAREQELLRRLTELYESSKPD